MKRPVVTLFIGDTEKQQSLSWNIRESDDWKYFSALDTVIVESVREEASLVVVWRGELWPKFNVTCNAEFGNGVVEMLGNKLLVRLHQLSTKTRARVVG